MRRSTIDALLLGCIPVLFMRRAKVSGYLPLHFAGWAEHAAVIIEPEPFLNGRVVAQPAVALGHDGATLLDYLAAIPEVNPRPRPRPRAALALALVLALVVTR